MKRGGKNRVVELNSLPPARKTGPLMIGLVVCLALCPSSPLATEGGGGGGGIKCRYSDQECCQFTLSLSSSFALASAHCAFWSSSPPTVLILFLFFTLSSCVFFSSSFSFCLDARTHTHFLCCCKSSRSVPNNVQKAHWTYQLSESFTLLSVQLLKIVRVIWMPSEKVQRDFSLGRSNRNEG